ncbi:helix-turn-helix domain-containing protein [Sphaerochaeta halotolerans]|jgi:transcriptional regulator with XRE-family HTH domain|uniref:XRE family transcriptional regulator n=1 Tax=Sphaerochaeta halotolerans TaxID=2293840 RepID=A0A372MGX9_9SPIR|nr:helix-turn-helix transcriptional regulator [Sphaerochaeta halotolerans]MBG0767469.1 helix-turn-helix transcriptional regulator [Spirochaetaceae bacterium]MXI86515.1 helix-turn-helix domain-containing protein [Sphaerochaeta halotolerans]RFU95035.1 XRE family transcriptional regulator [Sphaerochaeta halotolerans]
MKNREIGQAIKELRLQKNMTQEELIEKADLSRSQLYYIESGRRTPRLPTIYSICAALELTFLEFVHYLYRYSPTSSTPSISSIDAPGATIG